VLDPLHDSSATFRQIRQRRLLDSWILCGENDRPSQIYHPASDIDSLAFFRSTSAQASVTAAERWSRVRSRQDHVCGFIALDDDPLIDNDRPG